MGLKIAGYVTSDRLKRGFVSHDIQNRSIKEFLESQGHVYLLSWTEMKDRAPFTLRSLLQEDFYDGLSFFSIEQLEGFPDAAAWIRRFTERKLWIGFARERLFFEGEDSSEDVLRLLWLKRNLEGPRDDLSALE